MKGLIILGVIVIGVFVAWQHYFPRYTHRYVMTLEIEVDGEVKSGSAVIESIWQKQPKIGEMRQWSTRARSGGPIVDLDDKGVIAVALRATYFRWHENLKSAKPVLASRIPLIAFAKKLYEGEQRGTFLEREEILRRLSKLNSTAQLKENKLPGFIWFPDPDEPNSASPIYPDEFERVLGKGIRFRRVTITMTNAPIENQLDQTFLWLKAMRENEIEYGSSPGGPVFKVTARALMGKLE